MSTAAAWSDSKGCYSDIAIDQRIDPGKALVRLERPDQLRLMLEIGFVQKGDDGIRRQQRRTTLVNA